MKINLILIFQLSIFISSINAQSTEDWFIDYHVKNIKWEIESQLAKRGDTLFQLSYYDSIRINNEKIRVKYSFEKGKFSTIENYKIINDSIEVKDGQQLYFDKSGKLIVESYFKNGIEEEIDVYYIYYENNIPMLKQEQKSKIVWNIIEYYKPDGTLYTDYGDFKNGEGILKQIYFDEIDPNEIYSISYQVYINRKGKQKRKILK